MDRIAERTTLQVKRQQAKKFIEKELNGLGDGERLAPIRNLIDRSGLSRRMIEQAIDYYKDQNLLEVNPRSGIFRSMLAEPERREVKIIGCGEINYLGINNGFMSRIVELLYLNASRRNISAKLHRVKFNESIQAYENLAKDRNVYAYILLSPHMAGIHEVFAASGRPTITLFPIFPMTRGVRIVDSPDMMQMQLEYLFAQGHRKIAYMESVEGEVNDYSAQFRKLEYYRVMAENGCRVQPNWVGNGGFQESSVNRTLDKIINSAEAPTALICNDWLLSFVYRFLESRGLRIGRDISVMGTDGLEMTWRITPRPTTVLTSRRLAVSKTWDILERMAAGKAVEEINYTRLRLLQGETTAAPLP